MMPQAYVEMKHISKRFGTVQANDDVGMTVDRGEIVAILGENGSGKSTLVNMLSGMYVPDSGSIVINGEKRFFKSPQDAIAAGIGMVYQHFKLIPVMNAWENISLGEKRGDVPSEGLRGWRTPFLQKKKIIEKIQALEGRFGLSIQHKKKIYDMPVSEKQTVEILKVLYRGASVLVLDEPTAVLTPQETTRLFSMMRTMKAAGCAIIIITHKLQEVMEISDRVTVLRKGKSLSTVYTKDTNPRELTELMVGGSISLEIHREKPLVQKNPMLEVRSLSLRDPEGVQIMDALSFDVFAGEILGVAGIAGSGQKELCEIITGLRRPDSGAIRFLGENLLGLSPRGIKKKGIRLSFIPEDRLGMGLAAGMSITDNILLTSYDSTQGPLIDRLKGRIQAETIVRRYAISTPSVQHIVKKLSGGNIQKVLLGRELEREPRLLVTAYPVRGLDIGASYSIYAMLNVQKKRGVGVLFIGEDLDVLQELCDRIMVIHRGVLMDIVYPQGALGVPLGKPEVSKEDIGLLMLGHKSELYGAAHTNPA
ncbi:MAG: ABC transporter ATP-binding protein [Treponema sp.]|jgi:simple sugar transport system ATP-binding protein|nr:ABC transporter ATP-binding protein [Treponema sp.]